MVGIPTVPTQYGASAKTVAAVLVADRPGPLCLGHGRCVQFEGGNYRHFFFWSFSSFRMQKHAKLVYLTQLKSSKDVRAQHVKFGRFSLEPENSCFICRHVGGGGVLQLRMNDVLISSLER